MLIKTDRLALVDGLIDALCQF